VYAFIRSLIYIKCKLIPFCLAKAKRRRRRNGMPSINERTETKRSERIPKWPAHRHKFRYAALAGTGPRVRILIWTMDYGLDSPVAAAAAAAFT